MVVIKVQPEEIMKHWNQLRSAIMNNLPPIVVKEKAQEPKMMQMFLTGLLELWMADSDGKPVGFVATTTTRDPISDCLFLWIWLAKFSDKIRDDQRKETLEFFKKLAEEKKYEGVIFLGVASPDENLFEETYCCFRMT